MTGIFKEAGTAYHSQAPGFIPCFGPWCSCF